MATRAILLSLCILTILPNQVKSLNPNSDEFLGGITEGIERKGTSIKKPIRKHGAVGSNRKSSTADVGQLGDVLSRLALPPNDTKFDNELKKLASLATNGVRHPLVFWPGFGTSSIQVVVNNQEWEPDCPQYGSFSISYGNPTILEGWSEACVSKMLRLEFHPDKQTFSPQPGVSTSVADVGSTSCASIPYEPLYLYLEALGYTAGFDFFVACYDWRMSPYRNVGTDPPHLEVAKLMVEQAYANTGLPVYLSGHSNGPLYTLALLNSVSESWRKKYIAGMVGMAGNWAGQGGTLAFLFSGQSMFDSSWMPESAATWASWPASYMQLADPAVFGSREVLLQAKVKGKVKQYTAADYDELFKDADMPLSRELAALLVGNVSVAKLDPNTNFYGFYGSGIPTRVGVKLDRLEQGQLPQEDTSLYQDGDGDQEGFDNESVLRWQKQQAACLHFELNELKGSSHLGIPFSWRFLYRLAQIVYSPLDNCQSQ